MKPISPITPTATLMVVALAGLSAPILTSLNQVVATDERMIYARSTRSLEDLKSSFPSVEYGAEPATDDAVRRSKSKKYDKYRVLNTDATRDGEEVAFADWLPSGVALPVADSRLLIIGNGCGVASIPIERENIGLLRVQA